MAEKTKNLDEALDRAGTREASRHLFICIGPDCCASAAGEELWKHIKQRIQKSDIPVMRTKAGCFRICRDGPWLVVYPDGVWYGAMTPERFDRILQQHIIGGKPVDEWVVVINPLSTPKPGA